jgi:hypothetical protein
MDTHAYEVHHMKSSFLTLKLFFGSQMLRSRTHELAHAQALVSCYALYACVCLCLRASVGMFCVSVCMYMCACVCYMHIFLLSFYSIYVIVLYVSDRHAHMCTQFSLKGRCALQIC